MSIEREKENPMDWATDPNGNDALPLEYKLENRHARGYAHVADFVNNTLSLSFVREHERRFQEEGFRFLGVNASPFADWPAAPIHLTLNVG
jgi:hypothetical protein